MDAAQDWWFLLNHFLDKVDNFLALTIQFQFTIKCWYFIGFLIPTKEDNLKIIKVSKSRVFSSSFILIDKLEMVFHIFPSQKKKNGLLLLLGREETLGRLWGRSTLRQQSCKSAACFWYPSPRGGSTSAFVSKCEKKTRSSSWLLEDPLGETEEEMPILGCHHLLCFHYFQGVPKNSNPQAVFLRFVSGSPSSCSRNSPCFFWPSDDTMEMSWQILTSDISRFGKDLGILGGGRLMLLSIYPNTEGWLQISCNSMIYKPLKKYTVPTHCFIFTQLPCGICAIYFEL